MIENLGLSMDTSAYVNKREEEKTSQYLFLSRPCQQFRTVRINMFEGDESMNATSLKKKR